MQPLEKNAIGMLFAAGLTAMTPVFSGAAEGKVLNLANVQHEFVTSSLLAITSEEALELSRGRVVLLVGTEFDKPRLQTILRGLEQAQYPVEVYQSDWRNVPPNKLKLFYDGKPVPKALDKDLALRVVEPFLDQEASYLKGANPSPNVKGPVASLN